MTSYADLIGDEAVNPFQMGPGLMLGRVWIETTTHSVWLASRTHTGAVLVGTYPTEERAVEIALLLVALVNSS